MVELLEESAESVAERKQVDGDGITGDTAGEATG
jgi:hypothetical protein